MKAPWPRRPRLVAGNWKMNRTASEGAALAGELRALVQPNANVRIVLCPPFTAIDAVRLAIAGTPLLLGAQNVHAEPAGPFTGEISGPMLVAAGCRMVIIGHSERRHGMGEDDALVAKKLRAAHRDGLTPIVCVGETLAERERGGTADVLVRQVRAAFDGLDAETARASVIAYEPVWAIGTGKVASVEQAAEAHALIRATLDRVVAPSIGAELAILYGGSVNASNAAALFASGEIDGALVGGASLESASFWRIIAAAGG
jgi:triosephosphate isomerase (TIM)